MNYSRESKFGIQHEVILLKDFKIDAFKNGSNRRPARIAKKGDKAFLNVIPPLGMSIEKSPFFYAGKCVTENGGMPVENVDFVFV